MTQTIRDWTGKNHTAEVIATADNSEYPHDFWYQVRGYIDGRSVLLDSPVSSPNLTSARASMEAAIERYLGGQNHPTHYTGNLAYLVRK